jgi:hypothetical protein
MGVRQGLIDERRCRVALKMDEQQDRRCPRA